MAEAQVINERISEIGSRVAKTAGLEFVHCRIAGSRRNPTLRVFIDKPGGVTVEDCARVSREIEAVLDAEDFIPTSYVLEVSSPGIERELFKIADFERFSGHAARIKTGQTIAGQRNFAGKIVGVDDGLIEFDDRTHGPVRIPFASIAKANLMVDLREEFKKT